MAETKGNQSNMTIEEKRMKGLEYKQIGNEQFKAKDWKQALGSYHKALLHVTGFQTPDSEYYKYASNDSKASNELGEQLKQLQHDLYSNMSQIYIYQQKYEKALGVLEKAIKAKENGDTAKVLFRKAVAKLGLWDLEEAKSLFEIVMQRDASQIPEVEKQLQKLQEMQKKADKEAATSYKKMFK